VTTHRNINTPLAHQSTGPTQRARILVPTDFSSPARRAYTYAIRLAQALSAELVILHVVKAAPGLAAQSSALRHSLNDKKSHALLEFGRMVRLGQDAGVSVEHRLVVGVPDLSILDMAQESGAGMIVMGRMDVPAGTGFNSGARRPRSFKRPLALS
jgi:nucleotide-binding universal stress UspA family protein